MESIVLFAKNLVALVIVISALLNLTTGEKYEKYLRFIVGLMLVLYTMSSVMGFVTDYQAEEFSAELAVNGEEMFTDTEQSRNNMIDEAVLDSYSASILYSLEAAGYDVTRVECFYEEDGMGVCFYAASSNNLAGIKKYINNFYHVESSHIYGYTEAEDE